MGTIMSIGVATANSILMVTFANEQRQAGMDGKAAALEAGRTRMRPVLMTALTAGISLVPLVWAGQEPGREILYPVATVILGGLLTATFAEYLIRPGLFWRFSGRDAERLVSEPEA